MKENPLDKFLKHHTRTCSVHVYSGEQKCSCGRDAAIVELERIRELLRVCLDEENERFPFP